MDLLITGSGKNDRDQLQIFMYPVYRAETGKITIFNA
jgi:hypothetical protein